MKNFLIMVLKAIFRIAFRTIEDNATATAMYNMIDKPNKKK